MAFAIGGPTPAARSRPRLVRRWIQLVIRALQERDLNPGAVGVHRHDLVREVGVDGRAGALVILIALKQSHPDAHKDCTLDVVTCSGRVHDLADIHHGDDAAHAKLCNRRPPSDLDKPCAEAIKRGILKAETRPRLASAKRPMRRPWHSAGTHLRRLRAYERWAFATADQSASPEHRMKAAIALIVELRRTLFMASTPGGRVLLQKLLIEITSAAAGRVAVFCRSDSHDDLPVCAFILDAEERPDAPRIPHELDKGSGEEELG